MKPARVFQAVAAFLVLILIAGLMLPRVNTDRYRGRIQAALEAALGRKVTFGKVHFNLLTGPGFTLRDVSVAEDPALGVEPVAYVDQVVATPRLLSLLTGHLAFSSLRLEDAHLNLARVDLPSGEYRWNLEPLIRPAIIAAFPHLTIHGARINFKAADVKNVVYLLDCDMAIEPPSGSGQPWGFRFEGKPARADRPARGSGVVRMRGTWKPGSLDAKLDLERSELGDVVAVLRGEDAGLHGLISGSARFAGPLHHVVVDGRLRVEGLHGWNQDSPRGEVWPLDLHGWWNPQAQQLELDARVAGQGSSPLAAHYLVERYLTQPKWGASVTLVRFPAAPLVPLAQHLGLALVPGLEVTGTVDGVVGYSVAGGYRGQARVTEATLKLAGAPLLKVPEAQMMLAEGTARLTPTRVMEATGQDASVEGEYALQTADGRVRITARSLSVGAFGKQIPVLSEARAGKWSGELEWKVAAAVPNEGAGTKEGWSGEMQLAGVQLTSPALSAPVALDTAQCHLEADSIAVTKMRGTAGKIAFSGDYRYEAQSAHPHRFRIATGVVDAAELESLLMPALRRQTGVLGVDLPFRKQILPEWLAAWHAEGTVQMAGLATDLGQLPPVRAKVLWDAGRIALTDAVSGKASGRVDIDIRGKEPIYEMTGRLRNQDWKEGQITLDVKASGAGVGAKLLRSLEASGGFVATGLADDLDQVSGRYEAAWHGKVPRLELSGLRLQSAGESYSGTGKLQGDGMVVLEVKSATKQARVSGPLNAEQPLHWTAAP